MAKIDDSLWRNAQPVFRHEYTDQKGITPKNAKLDPNGNLIFRILRPNKTLAGFQTISENGDKRFTKGTDYKGNYLSVGRPDSVIYIVEGYADGITVWESRGSAVAVALNADNLKPVAEQLKAKYPDTKLVLVADNDADKETNIGVEKATEAARAVNGFIAIPDAPEGVKVDVNDLMLAKGQGAVRTLLEGAKRPEPLPQHDCLLINLSDVVSKPIEWLWPDRFPLGKLCLIGGPPSMGKTQIALWIAANVTTGGKWPDSEQHATIGDVIILSTEDDVADTLKPRLEAAGADVSRVHVLHAVLEVRDDEDR